MKTIILSLLSGLFSSISWYATSDPLSAAIGVFSLLIAMLALDIHDLKRELMKKGK